MAARCVAPVTPMRRSRPGALARTPGCASPLLSGRGSTSKPCAPLRAQYKHGMTLGEWCDENGEYGDKLVEEWYDPDRTVDGVTRGTKYRALWRCSSGCTKDGEPFMWEAMVYSRTRPNRAGCPGCAGQLPTDANNLRKWCEDNGEYGQKIVAQWAEPDVNMKDVTPSTHKKLLWRCSSGCTVDGEPLTWEAIGFSRTGSARAGCPGCTSQLPTDANNLLKWCQDNGEYGQKIVAEWAEPDVNMKDVLPGTEKKLLWRCSSGCTVDGEPFTWEAHGKDRTRPNRQGCPGCVGHVPTDAHNLLKWCQDNGEYGQKLIEEWAEPDVNMKDVTFGTNKKLLWRCSTGCTVDGEPFTWEATGNNRTRPKHHGCPGCSANAPIDMKKRLGKVAR